MLQMPISCPLPLKSLPLSLVTPKDVTDADILSPPSEVPPSLSSLLRMLQMPISCFLPLKSLPLCTPKDVTDTISCSVPWKSLPLSRHYLHIGNSRLTVV
ncbi:unnamed protein product [Boreogadus saida]